MITCSQLTLCLSKVERTTVSFGVSCYKEHEESYDGRNMSLEDKGPPRSGLSLNDAACGALLELIAHTVDTNMISRGGIDLQKETARKIGLLLEQTPFPDEETLDALNASFVEKNLSPGGCADLLAITLFLHFLKEELYV